MIRRRIVKRALAGIFLAVATVVLLIRVDRAQAEHPHFVYISGWLLFALILALTFFNARKKIAFIPMLSSRLWFLVHIYLGLFTAVVFMIHLRWRVPIGTFETILGLLFVGVTVSGILGWWLSRILPRRLTGVGGEVPFERIPIIRRDLREQAEKLVVTVVPTAGATTLADFYTARLSGFFAGPANMPSHWFGSSRIANALLNDLGKISRFLSADEKRISHELGELVRQKDALDFHRSLQMVLKGWLFVHIPLTYGLIVFTLAHIVLVYAFSGGAR